MSTLDALLLVWSVLTATAVVYVAYDVFTGTPLMKVMRWGWILVTLYTGPIGAALYLISCRAPTRSAHERSIAPHWKQTVGSTIHCVAGDAGGIIVAATITAAIGLPRRIDLVVEYAAGFSFGLLVFQALFMRGVLGGSYLGAVARTAYPEWVSMNAVMAGMIPVMTLLMRAGGGAVGPTDPRFWGATSLATMVGGALAYPVNWWLVAAGLKHGMGTDRALGPGGHAMDMDREQASRRRARSRGKWIVAAITLALLAFAVLAGVGVGML